MTNEEMNLAEDSIFRSLDHLVTALHSLGEQVDIISDRVSSAVERIETIEKALAIESDINHVAR